MNDGAYERSCAVFAILSSLKDDELVLPVQAVHEVHLAEGEFIARQGEIAHLLLDPAGGRAAYLLRRSADGQEVDHVM